jgi:hypothetical protein
MDYLSFQIPLISDCILYGMPLLAGFYSGDLILEIMLIRYISVWFLFLCVSTGLTVRYFLLVLLCFVQCF